MPARVTSSASSRATGPINWTNARRAQDRFALALARALTWPSASRRRSKSKDEPPRSSRCPWTFRPSSAAPEPPCASRSASHTYPEHRRRVRRPLPPSSQPDESRGGGRGGGRDGLGRDRVRRRAPRGRCARGPTGERSPATPRRTAAFERLSYTHPPRYVEWITEAKREDTRARRIAKTVERLRETKPPPSQVLEGGLVEDLDAGLAGLLDL